MSMNHEQWTDQEPMERPANNLLALTFHEPKGLGRDPFDPDAADLAGVATYTDAHVVSVLAAHAQRLTEHRWHLDRIANHAQGLPTLAQHDALLAENAGLRSRLDALETLVTQFTQGRAA